MTTGGVLYLLMSIGVFVSFSVVLGYQSWQQSRVGPKMVSEPGDHQGADDTVTA
jgi:hypothetical protein